MTNDHGGHDTLSLSDVVCVRGQGYQGTMIIGGITYPRVVVAGISIWWWRFCSGHWRLPAMMNDGNGGTIEGGAIKGGV